MLNGATVVVYEGVSQNFSGIFNTLNVRSKRKKLHIMHGFHADNVDLMILALKNNNVEILQLHIECIVHNNL